MICGEQNGRRARLAAYAAAASLAPDAGSEAIADVAFFPLREPSSGRRYTVLRLRTRSGVTGYGECRGVTPEGAALARTSLPGTAATAVEPVRARLGEHAQLQAAVNIALLDIAGKMANAPLYQLLGGPTRNRARAMVPLAGATDQALLESMKAARAVGHRAFSVPVPPPPARNQGQGYVRGIVRRLESLRTAGGDACDFVLAGEGRLTPGDAASVSSAVERFHVLWFDEPCRATGREAAAKVSLESVTPTGFGAGMDGQAEFSDLLAAGMIDVVRPEIGRHGITQIRKIAALAETYYAAVAPRHAGGPVATAAALHLAASLPNFFIQEVPFPASEADRAMRGEISGSALEKAVDGALALPAGPGLGIAVNEEAMERYRERGA